MFINGTDDPLNPVEGGEVRLPWGMMDRKPPIAKSLTTWERAEGCPSNATALAGPTGVMAERFGPCAGGTEVVTYIVHGLGHVWPGGLSLLPESIAGKNTDKLNATDVIWDFFRTHPKPGSTAANSKPGS